jgi:replication-associated recombination protein RarA
MGTFSELKTVNGYPADEVISALQKEIRRGNFESATFFGLELIESGNIFENKFWERILVISVEDVADPNVIPIISSLRTHYYLLESAKEGDRSMQAIKAIQVLCEAKKDRIIDEIKGYLKVKRREENYRPEIPDYAIDMHTKRGKERGRDKLNFLQESSKVNNLVENKNKKYADFLLDHELKKLD